MREAIGPALERYRRFYDAEHGSVESRRQSYREVSLSFYNLASDFYEIGWGRSIHFAPSRRGENRKESIARHERFLADELKLHPGMEVLDVGCGVGGPMIEIERYSGAAAIGLNINEHQISRAMRNLRKAGLSAPPSRFILSDMTEIPLGDDSLDAAFAIESTCFVPDRERAFGEILRVLKPGGRFASYEICLTHAFDSHDPEHVRVKAEVEEGAGFPELLTIAEILDAAECAGFTIQASWDRAAECDPDTPWYRPLLPSRSAIGFTRSRLGRRVIDISLNGLERLRLVPAGTVGLNRLMNESADAFVEAGRLGIVTPLFFLLLQKG
jgi:sterol 24-C-methyltransferase